MVLRRGRAQYVRFGYVILIIKAERRGSQTAIRQSLKMLAREMIN
jgi:hypothetical protein